MTAELTFIDTNILVYAHIVHDGDLRASQSRQLLKELWATETGVLSTQVLQEFYSVATRKTKLPRGTARQVVAKYAEWDPVRIDPLLIVLASKLEEDHTVAFHDALIVEAALRAGATKLLTEDMQHGRRFGNLLIENPFRP
ncbi:Predicted nucleic acid-binding protein, contains PIN domain [Saccharopolyspora shandongensis]|uniref:Predicted nucleic acid-binding protein, contains PIN domain n=1 Tax=Saccharopolyspora shandongensis TaxID=418495 RepID=A0A1H2WCP0_9PSEU|nr:PIN domain-containing protein [Saccharopolyspora shandongensis]SDW78311.1 Predicted nucleic acid-binding protein, contains PIN domain [Saccharopolyspora shandongensis]